MRFLKTLAAGNVRQEESSLAAFALDTVDSCLAALFIASEHSHFRARFRQALGQRSAQNPCPPNHYRHLTGKIE